MLKYIIKRILWIIPILIGVTIVVFTILYFSPGDPAYLALGDNATPEAVEAYRIEMGINGTYWERLGRTLLGLFQGDLGISYRSRTPVLNELLVRFSVTFNISAWSIVLGIILGIFFGIVAALKQNTILDSLCTGCALFGISMPMFWQGLMLILIFSVGLGWLPASGYGNITVMYLGQMVEKAGSAEIFAHQYHPYTKALISAIPLPKYNAPDNQIILKGEITSPINVTKSCRFAPRCVYAKPECFENEPQLEEIEKDHFVKCHFVREINGL